MAVKYIDIAGLTKFKSVFANYVKSKAVIAESVYSFTLSADADNPEYSVAVYNASADILEVYVNGFRLKNGMQYTLSGTKVKIIGTITAGTVIDIYVKKINFAW